MGKEFSLARAYTKVLLTFPPFVGIGWWLDYMEDERLTRFRDKSALFRRDPPPAKPSW